MKPDMEVVWSGGMVPRGGTFKGELLSGVMRQERSQLSGAISGFDEGKNFAAGPKCQCGCGQRVRTKTGARRWCRYARGHSLRESVLRGEGVK